MQRTLRRLAAVDHRTIDRYLAHLTVADGQEVVPLADILPNPRDAADEVKKFHRLLTDAMESRGQKLVGIHVLPTGSPTLKSMRKNDADIMWPLFEGDVVVVGDGSDSKAPAAGASSAALPSVDKSLHRVKHLEAGVVVRLDDGGAGQPAAMAPAVVFEGSRYSYFAPHTVGLTCDRGGIVRCVRSSWGPWSDLCVASGIVLSRDGEPVRVGRVSAALGEGRSGGIGVVLRASHNFATEALGRSLPPNATILISGLHPLLPATKGNYEVNAGPFGAVSAAVV